MPNSFSLTATLRDIEPEMAGNKTERQFLDFVVDGTPLYKVVRQGGYDLVTSLIFNPGPHALGLAQKAVDRLLGNSPDAPRGRTSAYQCPECFDLGCGALTVVIAVMGERVTWNNWRYQTDEDDGVLEVTVPGLTDFDFDRFEYEAALLDGAEQLRAG